MSASPLKIAINTQICPSVPGGAESNLLSLITQLAQTSSPIHYHLLCIQKHLQEVLPFTGLNQRTEVWPFLQIGYVPKSATPNRHWRKLLKKVLPTRLVNRAFSAYRKPKNNLKPKNSLKPPTPEAIDQFLRSKGITAVHFPYSLYFPTTLPFLYEPWDLQHRHYPEFFDPAEVSWREQLYRQGCEQAKLVITATQWTKQDLIEQYGIAPDKIAVIPRSSLMFQQRLSSAEKAAARKRYQLPERFALYPAMTFPHKNHLRLLTALARLRDEKGIVLPLICTGRIYQPHWPAIEAAIRRLGLDTQVQFLGAVPNEQLCALFSTAAFMIFPSLFEGLGLPLLEAMHHRLPILAARATCIPEVVGGAAMLFEGENVDDMLATLADVCQTPERIADLSTQGLQVLEKFSWERAASMFIACYRSISGVTLSATDQALIQQAIGSQRP